MKFKCNDEYVLNILNENFENILDFFEINLNIEVIVRVLDYSTFKSEYEKYLKKQISTYTVGFIEAKKNTLVYLKYNEWDKTFHKTEDLHQFNKVIIHELVHLIHSHYCNKNYPEQNIWEGVAYYLADQKGYDYYNMFKNIIDSNSHEQVLRILRNGTD